VNIYVWASYQLTLYTTGFLVSVGETVKDARRNFNTEVPYAYSGDLAFRNPADYHDFQEDISKDPIAVFGIGTAIGFYGSE